MDAPRVFVLFLFLLLYLGVTCHAEMASWVDENGVRHYSNTVAPANSTTMENVQEFKSRQEKPGNEQKVHKRERFGVLKMYQEEKRKVMKEKKQAEIRAYNKMANGVVGACEKRKKQRQAEKCQAIKEKLEKLRVLGWRKFYYFQLDFGIMSKYCRIDRRGVVHLDELDAEDERTWKAIYERNIKVYEKKVRDACRE